MPQDIYFPEGIVRAKYVPEVLFAAYDRMVRTQGLTMTQLAADCGCSVQTINRIFRPEEKAGFDVRRLKRVCERLDVKVDEVVLDPTPDFTDEQWEIFGERPAKAKAAARS